MSLMFFDSEALIHLLCQVMCGRYVFVFKEADIFNQDIGGWNVPSVCIYSCLKVHQTLIKIYTWNVIGVTDMSSMFEGASVFNQSIGNWTTSNVNDMSSMFKGASNFNQYIGIWDFSSVINMSSMFENARSFDNGGQSFANMTTSSVTIVFDVQKCSVI